MPATSTWAAIAGGIPIVDLSIDSAVSVAANSEKLIDLSSSAIIKATQGQNYFTKPAAIATGYRWKADAVDWLVDDMSGAKKALSWTGSSYGAVGPFWTQLLQDGGFNRQARVLSGYFVSSDTVFNITTESWSTSLWVRTLDDSSSSTVWSKYDPGDEFTDPSGYKITITTSGQVTLGLNNSTYNLTNTGVILQGAWYLLTVSVNASTHVATAMVNGVTQLSPSVTSASITTSVSVLSTYNNVALAELMFGKGVTTLAEHQAMYQQFQSTMLGLTYTRSGSVAYIVGTDSSGIRAAVYAQDQPPVAYKSDLVDAALNTRGWGIANNVAFTNLIQYADKVNGTGWTNSNVSVVDFAGEDPTGGYKAGTVTATANNGNLRWIFSSITAASHLLFVTFKRNGASDVTGAIRIIRHSTNAVIATQAITAGSTWNYATVVGTAVLNDTRVEILIDTNTKSMFVWGMQFGLASEWLGHIVLTRGATRANSIGLLTATSPTGMLVGNAGLIEATFSPFIAAQVAAGYIVDAKSGSAEIGMYRDTNAGLTGIIKDSGGTSRAAPATTGSLLTATKHRCSLRWNSGVASDDTHIAAPWRKCSGSGSEIAVDGGVAGVDGSAIWTPANPDGTISIGSTSTGTSPVDGVISKVRFLGGTAASTVPTAPSVVSVTSTYLALVGDTVLANPTSGGFNVVLPPALAADVGKSIVVKNNSSSTNVVVVLVSGSDAIDGVASYAINQAREAVEFVVTGAATWSIA
jgi:hypothetical protein